MHTPRAAEAGDGNERGFTLIELLVVIIIIGILAAIAIPLFLNQRQKSYDAAAKSDLRNLANFEEIYLNDFGSYASATGVQAGEPKITVSHGITLSVVRFDGENGYCLSAKHVDSPHTWYYDSEGGGLQRENAPGCPVTTSGTAGDSLVGN